MDKKILIIGDGAKAYALAKKLSQRHKIYVIPSNDIVKEFAECADIRPDSVNEIVEYALENGIDLTIPIMQEALKTNIVSLFENNNLQIFAPGYNAVQIVYDKAFAKKVLYKLRIPTPKFGIFEKENLVLDYIKKMQVPFVVKTEDRNSATVFNSYQVAKNSISSGFIEKNKRFIIEDYIYGTPFSFYTMTDGYKALPIGSSIMYKHYSEGDGGQLTSGMGACVPNYKLTVEQEYYLMDNVIYPTLDYLGIEGNFYTGILGINGIIDDNGQIWVLGWQSFMQDSDADAILNSIEDDLYNLMLSCVVGSFSDEVNSINIRDIYSASVVLSCKNLENTENIIQGVENLSEDTAVTYCAGVNKNRYLEYEVTQKGAVMVLTSQAATLGKAIEDVYAEVDEIDYRGKYYRKDIGK